MNATDNDPPEWADVEIESDSGPDLHFRGRVAAEVDSREPGRDQWSVLRLWRTFGGSWVAERQRWALDAQDRAELVGRQAAACPTDADVVAYLHHGGQRASWLTKDLLDLAGIPHAEVIP